MLNGIDDNKNLIKIYDNSEIDENIAVAVSNRVKDDLTNVNNDVFKTKVIESGYQSLHVGDYLSSAEDLESIDADFLRCDGRLIKKTDYPYVYERFGGYGTTPISSYTKEPLDVSILSDKGVEKFSYSSSFNYNSLVFNQSKTRAVSPMMLTIGGSNTECIVMFDTNDWSIIEMVNIKDVVSSSSLTILTSGYSPDISYMSPFIFLDEVTLLFCIRDATSRDYVYSLYKTTNFFKTTELIKVLPKGSSYGHEYFYGFGETDDGNQFVLAGQVYSSSSSYTRGISWLCWSKDNVEAAAGSTRNFGETYHCLMKLGKTWLFVTGAYAAYESGYEYLQSVSGLYILNISSTTINFGSFSYPPCVSAMTASDKMSKFLSGANYYKGKYIFGNKSKVSYITSDLKNYESFTVESWKDRFFREIYDFKVQEYPCSTSIFTNKVTNGVYSIYLYVAYRSTADQSSLSWSVSSYLASFSNFGLSGYYSQATWIENGKMKIIVGNTKTLDLQLLTLNFTDFNECVAIPSFTDTMSGFTDNDYIKRNFEGKKYLYLKVR